MDFQTTEEYIEHYNSKVRNLRSQLTTRKRIRHAAEWVGRTSRSVSAQFSRTILDKRIAAQYWASRTLDRASVAIEPKGVPGGQIGSRRAAGLLRQEFQIAGITDANFPALTAR